MRIAVAGEAAPARTLAPILYNLDVDCIGLSHGTGADQILKSYCNEIHFIGTGRGSGFQKRSRSKIAYLVLKDILKAVKALKGKKIDLLLTCGNAGDVRKGLCAANILKIPVLHLEQDIYNPIETIAFAEMVTAPSPYYKNYLEKNYQLKNVQNIGGYPAVSYIKSLSLEDPAAIIDKYGVEDFILLVLGGDLKPNQLPVLIKTMESLNFPVLIVPFRFDSSKIRSMIKSSRIIVLEGFVDLPSIMNASKAIVYGAGMGITLEAAALETPAIKISGFHDKHSSVDISKKVGIPVAAICDIPKYLPDLKKPKSKDLLQDAEKAVKKCVYLINNFSKEKTTKSGFKSFKKIWEARSRYR